MAPKKMLHLNFFDMSCKGAHMGVGMWKVPNDNSQTKDSLEYYIWLAKLAEKGKISTIFFADVYGGHDAFPGHAESLFRSGANVAQTDPTIWISAMAAVSKSVAFGITGSTSYINPFILARTWSTLDHATKGRIAWNVVTSYSNTSAQANGLDKIVAHDKRYEKAYEYLDLCYALWEGSWEEGSVLFDEKTGVAYDGSKVHKIHFKGNHHSTSAWGASNPSPQRTPVIFQAGSSTAGKAFAAAHAEAVFVGGGKPSDTAPYVKFIRAAAAANGRDPNHIKVFPQITPILGKTVEEAQAKYEKYKKNIDWEGGLAKLSGYIGFNLGAFPPDEPIVIDTSKKADNSIHAIVDVLKRFEGVDVTPRLLGERMAFCGFASMPIGTPEMVADEMERWVNEADIDGFNVAYVSNPESYEDLVELLVPVLQERGLMWKDYTVPGGTYRENLLGTPGQPLAPEGHPAAQFRFDVLKEKFGVDENGDITIDRVTKEAPVEAAPVEAVPVEAAPVEAAPVEAAPVEIPSLKDLSVDEVKAEAVVESAVEVKATA